MAIAFTEYNGNKIKTYSAKPLEEVYNKEPGSIISADKEGLKIACLDSSLLVEVIQFPNGKLLKVEQYINGHKFEEDVKLFLKGVV